jgi:hypothetical protein
MYPRRKKFFFPIKRFFFFQPQRNNSRKQGSSSSSSSTARAPVTENPGPGPWGRGSDSLKLAAQEGNEINTARRLLEIGFAPADLLYSESLTKSTKKYYNLPYFCTYFP